MAGLLFLRFTQQYAMQSIKRLLYKRLRLRRQSVIIYLFNYLLYILYIRALKGLEVRIKFTTQLKYASAALL